MANSTLPTADNSGKDKSSRLHTDTLASSVVILLFVTVIQRTVGFGRGMLFCRWLDPETLGQWEMAYSFLLFAAPLAVLGVPGSFGRYLEHYRQRGHLHTFLQRTTAWTVFSGSLAVGLVIWFAPQFSQLLFGSDDRTRLIYGIAICLAAIIIHHTLTSLLVALRLFRVVSVMNFLQSLMFAGFALGFLSMNSSVESIVISYGTACLLASLGAICWIWPALKEVKPPTDRLSQFDFWPRLLRFAFFVWVTNLLINFFAVVDRYMIVHYSGMASSEALEQVGYYHSSQMVPLLLVSVADLLGGIIMPHLSRDWEAGRREQVGKQLNLFVKLTSLGMLAMGVCILLFSPFLFEVVLAGKYSGGLSVLPWTLAGCIWYGSYLIARNYLWCAERTRLAAMPLAFGVLLNILLNLLLLPLWGLQGAVIATSVSTLVTLAVILFLSYRNGMRVDSGTWLLVISPLALTAGATTAIATLAVILIATFSTHLILTLEERTQMRDLFEQGLTKLKPWFQRRPSASGTA